MKPASPHLPHLILLAAWPALLINGTASAAPSERSAKSSKDDTPSNTHRVTRGETLWSIAMKHNTSVGEIMELNHMDDKHVKEGQLLKIKRLAETTPEAGSKKQLHIVHDGETLRSIAKEHHVAESDVVRVNPNANMKSLKTGSKLVIPSPATEGKTASSNGSATHTAADGETFYSIARKNHISVEDLMAANPSVKPDRVHEGLVLKLPKIDQSNGLASDSAKKQKPDVRSSESKDDSTKKPVASSKPAAQSKPAQDEKKTASNPSTIANTTTSEKPKDKDASAKPAVSPKPTDSTVALNEDKPKAVDVTKPAPMKITEVRSYTVAEGETIDSIAAKHGINSKRLLDYNLLPPVASLRAGDEIMIPRDGATVVKR